MMNNRFVRQFGTHAQPLATALRFLTLLPWPTSPATSTTQDITRAIAWFPVVGLIIGLLLVPVGWLAGTVWDAGVRAAGIVIVWGIITAGLHLDGLSDTFDAVMSWRSRERKLAIMRDSHVGAMGVLAVVAVLLLKFVWLQASGDDWWRAVMLAPIWGRWAQVYGLHWFPSARSDGLGHAFQSQTGGRRSFCAATAAALLITISIAPLSGIVAGLLVWGSVLLLANWWNRSLGGLTGDTYGALCEISEVVVLATLAA